MPDIQEPPLELEWLSKTPDSKRGPNKYNRVEPLEPPLEQEWLSPTPASPKPLSAAPTRPGDDFKSRFDASYGEVEPPVAGAKPGVDAQGRPGWFLPNSEGGHVQVMKAGAPVPAPFSLIQPREVPEPAPGQSFSEMSRNVTQRARNTALGTGPGSVSEIPGAVLPFSAIGAGVLGGAVAPVLGRGVLSAGKAAGIVGKVWLAEKMLETLVPEQYQPGVVKYMRALGEAH
jgi:hypothetical protein